MDEVVERWETGPVGPPPVERQAGVAAAVFSSRPWDDGTTATPRIQRRSTASRCASTCAPPRQPWSARLAHRRSLRGHGPTLAVGGAKQIQAYARRRLARETDDTTRAWWQEVIGALAR